MSAKSIIGIVIAMLLTGILLPIAIPELTGFDLTNPTSTATYNSETSETNYSITLYSNEGINIDLNFANGSDTLNLSLYNPSGTSVASDDTNASLLEIDYNATTSGTFQIRVENLSGSSITYNITWTITTYIDSDTEENIEQLVGEVMPIVAVVAIVLMYVAYRKYR